MSNGGVYNLLIVEEEGDKIKRRIINVNENKSMNMMWLIKK